MTLFALLVACQDSEYNGRMVKFFLKGNEALSKQDYSTALRYYSAGIEIDSSFADIYNNRGIVYFETNQPEEAAKDYARAIKLNPQLINAYFNRANLYFSKNKFKEAIQDFSRVVKAYPDSAEIYFYRARAFLQDEQYQNAFTDLNEVIKKLPHYAEAYDSRGYVLIKLGKYEEAQKDLSKAISTNEKLDLAWANLGLIQQLHKQNLDSAQFYLEKALQINPDEGYTLCQIGSVYIEQKQLEKAAQVIRKMDKQAQYATCAKELKARLANQR